MHFCSFTQGQAATFECMQCKRYACAQCARRIGTAKPVWECPGCKGMLTELAQGAEGRVARAAGPRVRTSVFARMPECLSYVVSKSVILTLVGLALVCSALYWAAGKTMGIWVIVGYVLAFGLEAALYFHVVEQTAHGVLELEPPEFQNAMSDIAGPAFRYLASIAPILAGVVLFATQVGDFWAGVMVFLVKPTMILEVPSAALLVGAGVLLWPLLTLAGAMGRSVLAMYNPANWVRTLRIMGSEYWAGVIMFYGVLAADVFTVWPARFWLATHLNIPVLGGVLVTLIGYFPFVLRARVLGAAAEPFID
jgi:hypothetical protein